MCANIGVDPLASNKGMWAQLLGFGDFYYELGVQIVEACLATRAYNGGFMELGALRNAVQVKLGQHQALFKVLMAACQDGLSIVGNIQHGMYNCAAAGSAEHQLQWLSIPLGGNVHHAKLLCCLLSASCSKSCCLMSCHSLSFACMHAVAISFACQILTL